MDGADVLFSPDFVRKLEDLAILGFVSSCMPEEQARPAVALLRAFSKRGIPVKTVLEVFGDLAQEEGFLTSEQ